MLRLRFLLSGREGRGSVHSGGGGAASLRYGVVLVAAMSFACGCDESPAFPVPHGPPKRIALDVRLPVSVLGRWTEDTTAETLREELAKYNIQVVDRRAHPDALVHVDLGQFTYREWQEIDVWLGGEGNEVSVARIRVPDLSWTTLQAATIPAAQLVARSLWMTSPAVDSVAAARPLADPPSPPAGSPGNR